MIPESMKRISRFTFAKPPIVYAFSTGTGAADRYGGWLPTRVPLGSRLSPDMLLLQVFNYPE